jgi:hypothetical protein
MNPIRNETSLILVVAVIFSAIAIPVLSGFLEPSQPPAVAAVQIGDPRDGDAARGGGDDDAARGGGDDDAARGGGTPSRSTEPQPKLEPQTRESRPAGAARARRSAQRPAAPPPSSPAPPDDAADDDGGEAD